MNESKVGKLVVVPKIEMGLICRCESCNVSIPTDGKMVAFEISPQCRSCDFGGHGTYICASCAIELEKISLENVLAFAKMEDERGPPFESNSNGRVE